ncbi:MAG: non-homologous end-joining DNA ligase [Acidimicrobiales bacterium]
MNERVERVEVSVGERRLSLSNLDKVLYPAVGFTKSQVIDYYARVAEAMLPHVSGRCMTLRRWPNGVDEQSFFEKRCPGHRPEWVETALGPGDGDEGIDYCRLDEQAALVWTANLAALELHSPMARCADLDTPTMVVFDLDPGEPAGIVECCRVAIALRELLAAVNLEAMPKTSGSKGLQVYVPLNAPHSHRHASSFARAAGQMVAKQQPDKVLVEMAKNLRPGKVFVDWSQNSRHKTTIAPYSLRARDRPTVSTPVTWDEVADGADGLELGFEADAVLDRVAALGDLFEPTVSLVQELPNPG